MKSGESSSWSAHVKCLLSKYGLPPASALITNSPSKNEWKKAVNGAVHGLWTKELRETARDKSSLQYLNLEGCSTDSVHPVWQDLSCPLAIKKATVKAMLLTKRYPLSTSPTAGINQSDTCPLCKRDPETTTHFILQCSKLSATRLPYIRRIMDMCRNQNISIDLESITRIVLDSTHLPVPIPNHEETCRNFVFKMHNQRAIMLGGESSYSIRH